MDNKANILKVPMPCNTTHIFTPCHIQSGKLECEQLTLRPTQIGTPMMMAGTAIAAIRLIPTGAPTNVPSCQRIFFLRLHGFLPQNVQPDGLQNISTMIVRHPSKQYNKKTLYLVDKYKLKIKTQCANSTVGDLG